MSDQIVVADGYGISLTVNRGHLVIHDGLGSRRRTRRYPRIERDLRRILILGHTGSVTLEAMRWCTERGIPVTQLDADNKIIMLTALPGLDDARLRRAQAHANMNETGQRIAELLLGAKIEQQAAVTDQQLAAPQLATSIRGYLPAINLRGDHRGLLRCRVAGRQRLLRRLGRHRPHPVHRTRPRFGAGALACLRQPPLPDHAWLHPPRRHHPDQRNAELSICAGRD